jgi:hypothetical protein
MGSSHSSTSSFKFGASKRRLSQEFNSDTLIGDRDFYQRNRISKTPRRPNSKKELSSFRAKASNCHD